MEEEKPRDYESPTFRSSEAQIVRNGFIIFANGLLDMAACKVQGRTFCGGKTFWEICTLKREMFISFSIRTEYQNCKKYTSFGVVSRKELEKNRC